MNNNLRTLSFIAISGLVTFASIQTHAIAGSSQVHGNINSQGEVHNESGQLLGTVKMDKPGTAFDIQHMNIKADGTVVDASGATVGRLQLEKNWYSKANAKAAKQSQAKQTMASQQETETNVLNEKSVVSPAAETSTAQASGNGVSSEFEQRRLRLENSIQASLSEGIISENQANHYRHYLVQPDTPLTEHKLNKLYKKWDKVSYRLDELRSRYAGKKNVSQ